ncbi:endonuclease III [Corallococcus sp. M34]|uniref:endonuclease III n=1 Tax=Citreicoccus inhibens TaxID=2849499 RepID=UPI001C24A0A1|nr:endonuclease III [Citreicoccus inhibens]MBU8894343.1 endonuclease III [Citreicoccus inhibens]
MGLQGLRPGLGRAAGVTYNGGVARRETAAEKRQRAVTVLDRLEATMPDARIELDYRTPLELLVAVVLSAQCTDKRVNMVTPALFQRFPDAAAYARAEPSDVEPFIRTCGLYRAKAKNIVAAARVLMEEHGGQVPLVREVLEKLPGVGRKTAGVVCIHLGGDLAFPVDTHVKRLAYRLGFTSREDPDPIEADMQAIVPKERWTLGHQLLVWHGRRTCFARSPDCEHCPVADLCPKRGVSAAKAEPAPKTRPTTQRPPRAKS